jgi:hypothetical protein
MFAPGGGSLPVTGGHLWFLGRTRGAEQGEGGNTVGRQQRHPHGDETALTYPNHRAPGYAELVEQAERVTSQVPAGERPVDRSAAVAALVHRDQPKRPPAVRSSASVISCPC